MHNYRDQKTSILKCKKKMNKYNKFSSSILILIFFLLSCNPKVEDIKPVQSTSKSVFITGSILNSGSENKTVTVYVMDILSGDQLNNVSLVDNDGNFQIKFNLYYSQDVLVKYGDNFFPLIVHPEDSINITFDANDISEKDKFAKSVEIIGDAAELNTNLLAFEHIISKTNIPHGQYQQYEQKLKPEDFVAVLDSLRIVQKDVASKFIEKHSISKELEKWIRNEIEMNYVNRLALYAYNRVKMTNLDNNALDQLSSYEFMNIQFTKEMLNNSKSAYFIGRYRITRIRAFSKKFSTESLIGYLWDRKGNTYFGSSTEQEIGVITDITKDKFLEELLVARSLFSCLERREIDEFEKHYLLFSKIVAKPFLKEPIINKYIKTKRNFENPEKGENSLLISAKDTPANELIKKIIEEHKGQIVYLDIWSTWCSPCRNEMPYSRKLFNELNSDKIDFAYLCTDSKENIWKALISEMEIEGSHYLATPAQSRFVYELFEMSGVPHYILIDENGNVVENGNHLRPSLSSTKSKILNLLNE